MSRSTLRLPMWLSMRLLIQRRLLLLICLLAATALAMVLSLTVSARPGLPQEISPLSPLPQGDTETSPLLPSPSGAPDSDLVPLPSQELQVTDYPAPVESEPLPQSEPDRTLADTPAELSTPTTNPAGVEPERAQLSLVLVALILLGLVGVVVSIVAQARRT